MLEKVIDKLKIFKCYKKALLDTNLSKILSLSEEPGSVRLLP